MLLSLRSNPQTISSYIQKSESLYTRTGYHILLPIVKKANSELELSQLLFISIRQRELVRVLAILDLSTYITFSWSMHSLSITPTKLYDIMCHDM